LFEAQQVMAFDDYIETSHRKFLFYDGCTDSKYWWVKADNNSFIIKNQGGYFSTSFTLRQQLI